MSSCRDGATSNAVVSIVLKLKESGSITALKYLIATSSVVGLQVV